MSPTITFEALVERLGFEIAVCLCDRELDEQFWTGLTDKQKESILSTALPINTYHNVFLNEDHEDRRSGCEVIKRLATTFDDWLKVYEQITRSWRKDKALHEEAVAKLKELTTTFSEWHSVHRIGGELRNYSLAKMDKLAHWPNEHAEVLKAACGKTNEKVAQILKQAEVQAGRQLAGWEKCEVVKDVELETEMEKRHWQAIQATRPTWDKVHELTWQMDYHPIPSKAIRETQHNEGRLDFVRASN
jgi:hypothetical protein